MDYEQIDHTLANAPSIKLLKRDSAALVISFLFTVFKAQQRLTIPYGTLIEELDAVLDDLRERYPERHKRAPSDYLKGWASDGLIRIIYRDSDEPSVELTSEAERVLGWFDEQQRKEFIGTDSRFRTIFQFLEEIVASTTLDVGARLRQLEAQREEIQAQIERIQATGRVDAPSETVIKERFLFASELARQMIRDFDEVHQNFRAIAQRLQEQQLRPDMRKGALVGDMLDADANLRNSDQGRSFYAFWDFLMSPRSQATLEELLQTTYGLPALAELTQQHYGLRQLQPVLIEAGRNVVRANYRIAEQVRRLLDDQTRAEHRRARDLIQEIKRLALRSLATMAPSEQLCELEGEPDVQLVMERPLWQPPATVAITPQALERGQAELDSATLSPLYQQFYVDPERLRQHIAALLEQRDMCTLQEVLGHYPPTQGLAEIITYFEIASKNPLHSIEFEHTAAIMLPGDGEQPDKIVSMPQVIFRSDHERAD